MLGVLWPVVYITQHPEPMYPAVANTSSNSRLGDVCQSQLWPMGSSHTLSHSINSNWYLTQMCHTYPDIAFTLNWHNSRGNSIVYHDILKTAENMISGYDCIVKYHFGVISEYHEMLVAIALQCPTYHRADRTVSTSCHTSQTQKDGGITQAL